MRSYVLLPVVFAVACAVSTVASAVENSGAPFPPHTIPDSQLRVLSTNAAGRTYQLHVGLPADYAKETGKRYPVVYVTDAYWDFVRIETIQGTLVYDRVAPAYITVGLGYAGENLDYGDIRRWDLTPVPFEDNGERSGHAADFLRAIEHEIIPFIEREYRVDSSYRVLAGASLGGLFTLYSMYTRPELFQAYVAATPAVGVGDDWIFGYEETFAKSGKPLKARLYMTAGGNEWPAHVRGIQRFNERLAKRAYDGFVYQFRLIDDERHAAMQLESYTRGLRFAFVPRAPETGPIRGR